MCSSTCGRGYRSRTRTCTPPQFGGDRCDGPEKQTKFCNIAVCPGKQYISTADLMTSCSLPEWLLVDPLNSQKKSSVYLSLINVLTYKPVGWFHYLPLLLLWLSVDGVWNEWSGWSSCSATCSNGTMQRTRECNGPSYGGSECRGEWLETVDCFLGDCPGRTFFNRRCVSDLP